MGETMTIRQLEMMANILRQHVITMLETAGSGHSAGSLDLADVMTALYFRIMNIRPEEPEWAERDLLFLSNGHVVPVQYAAMAERGYFDVDELKTLRAFGSRLQGHPERTRLPGIESTSGPLGCGLSQAAGAAYVLQHIDHQPHRHVYVITGDGELDEGNIWEAAMFAGKYALAQLTVLIDRNNIQIDGTTEYVMPLEDLAGKWKAFGWHVQEVDGHNIESLIDAADMARAITTQPSVIIMHTIPGKGVDFMEYNYHWHGGAPGSGVPNHAQARQALDELRTLRGKITHEGAGT
ncbi:transketolase [Candidatus Saccharibacteria bacterium]|nr:MAG: transketolase [Candidatus Saccharibacteria bacterium]